MLKTFDVTHFRRYVTPPDNTSKQIRRFAFSVIDVYKEMVESRPHALMTPIRILLGALKGKAVLWLKFQIRALAGR